jgi:hypothetical protein
MRDLKPFSVTILEEHLDAAIPKADEYTDEPITERCIMAKAVRPVMKGAWIAPGGIAKRMGTSPDFMFDEWQGDWRVAQIVFLFDEGKYETIREWLPVNVTFTPIEEE